MNPEKHNIAWQFHHNTCRWKHDTLSEFENTSPIAPFKEYADVTSFPLPDPQCCEISLKEVIKNRHSCRDFLNAPISLQDISTILNYGYGVHQSVYLDKNEFLERPVPSGGGLYSLELYILVRNVETLPQGIYHFCISPSCIEQISIVELPAFYISQLFMNQFYLANCSCIVMVTSLTERNMWKYGDRGYRYILFEAGHLVQNMNLVAQSLGLGSLNLGGFFDHEMAKLLKINTEEEIPLYAMALGKPSNESKEKIRLPDGLNY